MKFTGGSFLNTFFGIGIFYYFSENDLLRLNKLKYLFCICFLFTTGCEETDIRIAADASLDAVKAITLSDKAIQNLADESVKFADNKHQIAPASNKYSIRLERLVGNHFEEDGVFYDYKVYLSENVNAFAMANGSIRIYSGLMDLLDDGELRFVIGHEIGHVVKKHIRKKIQLAYGASAVRKTIASQDNLVGEILRSQLGGLVEAVMGAQFSQHEEKEADDYGISFLKNNRYEPEEAVSALKKLAALGNEHSFLSSHPDPAKRVERLKSQLVKNELAVEEGEGTFIDRVFSYLAEEFPALYEKLKILPWMRKEGNNSTI